MKGSSHYGHTHCLLIGNHVHAHRCTQEQYLCQGRATSRKHKYISRQKIITEIMLQWKLNNNNYNSYFNNYYEYPNTYKFTYCQKKPLSFSMINCFTLLISSIQLVLSLWINRSIVWLSHGWDIVDRRYVSRCLRAENVLSAVAVVTGRVKISKVV